MQAAHFAIPHVRLACARRGCEGPLPRGYVVGETNGNPRMAMLIRTRSPLDALLALWADGSLLLPIEEKRRQIISCPCFDAAIDWLTGPVTSMPSAVRDFVTPFPRRYTLHPACVRLDRDL